MSENDATNRAATLFYTLRITSRLSQRKLASKIDVSNQTISNAEDGRNTSAEVWIRLAEYFGWPVDVVLWLAGMVHKLKPPKEEIIAKIEEDLSHVPPRVRRQLIRDLHLDE